MIDDDWQGTATIMDIHDWADTIELHGFVPNDVTLSADDQGKLVMQLDGGGTVTFDNYQYSWSQNWAQLFNFEFVAES